MTIINVSNDSQLKSALQSARGGDEIRLAGGDYSLSMKNMSFSSAVTITSANSKNPAQFDQLLLTNMSNLIFDDVDLKANPGAAKPFVIRESDKITIRDATIDGVAKGGYGDGHGIWIAHTDNFTLENSVVSDFHVAAYFLNNHNLTIRNNSFDNIARDAMILGGVHDVLIADNEVQMNVKDGTKHTDGIQFWNTGTNNPASDVTVKGNYIATNGTESHGIYAANGLAQDGGGSKTFYSNFKILDNTVISAQMSGIAIGETNGLQIDGNTVLQDTEFRSSKEIRTPVIHVMADSRDVSITDNVVHETPEATGDNWQPVKSGNPGAWKVANNKVVPIGTTAKNAPSTSSNDQDDAPAPAPAPDADGGENGKAQTFRFDGDQVDSSPDTISGFDFGEGDQIVLIDYVKNTFKGQGGGNKLDVTLDGTYVKINSADDIRELDANSSAVRASEGDNDALIIRISQSGEPEHVLQIAGYADDYFV